MKTKRNAGLAGFICLHILGAAAFAAQVDNPSFKAWAKLKPGSSVTLQTTSPTIEITETTKLLEVKADGVVVEVTSLVKSGASSLEPSVSKMTIPAKVDEGHDLPSILGSDAALADAVISGEKTSAEKLTLKGKVYDTERRSIHVETEEIKADVTLWFSLDIPGGLAKLDMSMPGHSSESWTLIDFVIAK